MKASQAQLEEMSRVHATSMKELLVTWDRKVEARRQVLALESSALSGEILSEDALLHRSATPRGEISGRYADEYRQRLEVLSARLDSLRSAGEAQGRELERVHLHVDELGRAQASLTKRVEVRLEEVKASATLSLHSAASEGLSLLQLRVDALTEGLATEARIREEAVWRLEAVCRKTGEDAAVVGHQAARKAAAAAEAGRETSERHLHALLEKVRADAERTEGDWREEARRRQDAERTLRELRGEIEGLRSELSQRDPRLRAGVVISGEPVTVQSALRTPPMTPRSLAPQRVSSVPLPAPQPAQVTMRVVPVEVAAPSPTPRIMTTTADVDRVLGSSPISPISDGWRELSQFQQQPQLFQGAFSGTTPSLRQGLEPATVLWR